MHSFINKVADLLPDQAKEILSHAGFKKYFKNTGWMIGARVVSLGVSFFVVGFVARYLGPTQYGDLSYAQSFVTILSVLASLGIDQILYRDLIARPEEERAILGTAFYMKIVFGIGAFLITLGAAFLAHTDTLTTWLIAIIAFTFVLQPFGIIANYLNAHVQAKHNSIITIFLAFLLPAVKIALILKKAPLPYFAGIFVLESSIYAIYYYYIYRKLSGHHVRTWRFNTSIARQLLKDGWPLVLASLFGYIYARIDQVMLGRMLGLSFVGIYDAAVRISEVWYFLPGMVVGSLFPAIINARLVDKNLYFKRLRMLFYFVLGISVAVSAAIFLIASPLIHIVFGAQYEASISIVHIYVWAGVGMAVGGLAQQYLVAENFGKIFFYISFGTAVVNVILNLFLIPAYGAEGAATATLTSYLLIPLSLLIFSSTRKDISRIFSRTEEQSYVQ
jgi:O-antigen/teichoic acid export membrane protein